MYANDKVDWREVECDVLDVWEAHANQDIYILIRLPFYYVAVYCMHGTLMLLRQYYEAFSLKTQGRPGDKHSNSDVGQWVPQISKINTANRTVESYRVPPPPPPPREDAGGFKSRIRPPYPQRVVKCD